MVQVFLPLLLIGVAAGSATALLFASVASGSSLSVLLFYLAPLPILIAAIGWSHWAGLIAALVAAAGIGVLFGPYFFFALLIGIGLPSWWLGYLTLLARPAAEAPGGLEWYPVGHLVFWAALISAAIVVIGMLNLGTDEDGFRATLRSALSRALQAQGLAPEKLSRDASDRVLDVMVAVLPIAASIIGTVVSVVNLGLAARVVNMSGRLRRPWPELSAMIFPAYAPAALAVAVAGSFVPGMIGLVASIAMGSLLTAYTVLGFAVLHAVSRGNSSRPFLIGGAYTLVSVLFWPALVMTLLGLADTFFDFRGRAAARSRGPNHPQT